MSTAAKYISLLKEMLAIPAMSREEKLRADFLENWLKAEGHQVDRIGNNLLLGAATGKEKAGLLFCSHIDTVPVVNGWQSDPLQALCEGDKIIALGANDAGASVVSMIAAYEQLSAAEGQLHPVLLLVAEEEVSGKGGLESVLPVLGNIEFALVGEPTGMQPAVAQRGLMVVDAKVKGKAGHAARNEGVNAIMLALEAIATISKMDFTTASEWLPAPSLKVTVIEGGKAHNVIPDECTFVIDVRSNDLYNNEDILEKLTSSSKAQLAARSTRLKATSLPAGHWFFELAAELGLEPFGSSTLSDMALMPFPSVKIGPGDSSRSHTAGEWISVKEIEEGIAGYLALAGKLMEMKGKNF